ncbi:hypothetical protein F0562_021296 [Nyssa sinensis]|uniref:EID1-like F-box protein 3 n=1 Tax=Nyssa sinensis TaxID=561372 RepID=A0A5J5BK60_9ASTE|nr:hypothetical protein F0562_021296 [Nyssa sinensis]
MSTNQRQRPNPPSEGSEPRDSGILNERILVLVFESISWDIQVLVPNVVRLQETQCHCEAASVEGTRFQVSQPSPGHFLKSSRFSKTSGQSFLTKKCKGDLLYVSDLCEHPMVNKEYDLGNYRGVFWEFKKSRTRACLIRRQVAFEETVRCPYCGARVWSMTTARLVPKSAARRLGSHDGGLEYFVCVNGHLHGTCWLVPLSSDEDDGGNENDDGRVHDTRCENLTVTNGSISSTDDKVVWDYQQLDGFISSFA